MSKYAFLFTLVLITASAFRCNSSVTKTSDYGNIYFPITEGNYWKYINEAPRDESITFTVKVKDVKKVDGELQFKTTSFPFITNENTEQTLKQKTNGEIEAINYFSTTGIFTPSSENFKKGYEWNFGVFKGYVNDNKISITTEAGTFDDCYYIMMTDGFTFSFEMWYKKGVGIVKWGANRTNPPTIRPVYYVLKEYNIN